MYNHVSMSIWRDAPVFSFDWVLTTLDELLDSLSRAYYIVFNPMKDWLPDVITENEIFADWFEKIVLNDIQTDAFYDMTLWQFIAPLMSLLVAIAFFLFILKFV